MCEVDATHRDTWHLIYIFGYLYPKHISNQHIYAFTETRGVSAQDFADDILPCVRNAQILSKRRRCGYQDQGSFQFYTRNRRIVYEDRVYISVYILSSIGNNGAVDTVSKTESVVLL